MHTSEMVSVSYDVLGLGLVKINLIASWKDAEWLDPVDNSKAHYQHLLRKIPEFP